MLKVSAFYLEKQKSFTPKNIYFLSRCQYQNKKALFTDPIFSEGFGRGHWRDTLENSISKNITSGCPYIDMSYIDMSYIDTSYKDQLLLFENEFVSLVKQLLPMTKKSNF